MVDDNVGDGRDARLPQRSIELSQLLLVAVVGVEVVQLALKQQTASSDAVHQAADKGLEPPLCACKRTQTSAAALDAARIAHKLAAAAAAALRTGM